MTLTIRFATPRDADTIVRFIRGLAQYEREPNAVEVTASQIRAQMESADPPFECLLAEFDAEAVAFALFFRNYSTWRGRPGLYLEDIFVRDEYRGRGVGGALIRRLAQIALERGCTRIEWAVLNWNTPAQSFYREYGARPLDSWTIWRLEGDALARAARA
ncbi:MAG TPA: GNAT family N-acetyltransferase [Candidatus Binataceae bacterium]|nr:GNAT family N-acetyltransferase [Candidatus Binataceae bacterium]